MISKHFLNHLKFTPLLFFFFPIIAFASNIGEEDFSTLNPTSVNRLLKLPLSYVESNSLFIKNKNVSSVGFSRGANQSSLSFDAKESLLTDGLSIRLVKSGEKNISAAVIVFKSPINISTFDSLVIWLKSNRPDSKLSFGFKDVTGKIYRSPTVPDKNLVKNKFGQLVIPFKYFQNISNKVPVSHLSIEIDSNPETKGTVIEFAGISFILQPKIIAKPMIFYPRVISPANLDQASISPVDSILEEKALGGVSFMEVETLTSPPLPPVPAPEKITPASIKKTTQQKPSFTKWLEDFFLNRQWGIIILSVLIGIGVGLYYWAIKRRYQRQSKLTLQRLLKFIHWPFVFSENDKSIKNEKDFWKGLSEENIKTCILSTDGVVINESKNENFYGETFLKRQINLAKKHNIKVIPSLSFSQTGFNYEIFLSNPNLYKITPIPLSDRGLSDEELRIKFKYHFPIWIPPFWQKKYSLPHRILVAYGIKSGAVASYDTVQLNIKSPELKTEAERLLQSFAQVSSAIRIEGASTLLENEPIINGNQSYLSKTWKEIIHQTKMKNPHVLFFADNSGQNNIDWENFGFDYYENNQLLTLLTDQINRGDAGQLNKFFNEENLAKIKRSIFNLSHISSTDLLPTTRHRLLAACLIGLLPGIIQHDDNLNTDLEAYISEVSKMAVIRYGKFKALPTTSHHVFSFARAHGHDLLVAVVNLSIEPIRVNVFLDSFVKGFDDNKMYLVSNPLQHIPLSIESIQSTTGPGPTMAIWGNDFKKNGLSTQLDKLSIRLFSVNLSHPILHDTPEPIQQFHKV